MKKLVLIIFISVITSSSFAQRTTENDGNWNQQYIVLKNTAEADLMIRVGDIDNLGFGFAEDFNPFSGRSTWSHEFPWEIKKENAGGTDRIMVPSGFKYGSSTNQDGYTSSTKRPENKPLSILVPIQDIKDVTINSAAIQMFIDDFQSPEFGSKFQFKINGVRFTEAEKMINLVNQSGPIGKLITLRFTPEMLSLLKGDSLVLFADDPTTGMGDGFAVDFVKLLINPKNIYKGTIKGTVIDATTREPIAHATVGVDEYGTTTSDADGNFTLENIPAGLAIVNGSLTGYSSNQKQVDVIADEISETLELELKPSSKVTFNNKILQEGDNLVMNNIQFDVNSATLLAPGKAELDKLAAFMKESSSVEILLSGHTSSEGTASLNRELSLKRVRSCKDFLVSKGIDDGRITIKGFGPDQPIAPNDNEANRARNRRVEMKIMKL